MNRANKTNLPIDKYMHSRIYAVVLAPIKEVALNYEKKNWGDLYVTAGA